MRRNGPGLFPFRFFWSILFGPERKSLLFAIRSGKAFDSVRPFCLLRLEVEIDLTCHISQRGFDEGPPLFPYRYESSHADFEGGGYLRHAAPTY
jgi:hypothetical protein